MTYADFDLRYRPIALRYCRYLLRHTPDTEDIAQDALIHAWLAWARFDQQNQQHARAWFLSICRNAVISYVRRRQRHPTTPFTEEIVNTLQEPTSVERLAALRAELAAFKRWAVSGGLTPPQRRALRYHVLTGNGVEAARALRMETRAYRQMMVRIRQRVKGFVRDGD